MTTKQMPKIEELEVRRAALQAELAELEAAHPLLHLRQQAGLSVEEYRSNLSRRREVNYELGDIGRALAAARRDRGIALAGETVKSTRYREAVNAVIAAEAELLEPWLRLRELRDSAILGGAVAEAVPGVPRWVLERVDTLVRWTAELQRAGVALDMSEIPATVRARLEAPR